MQLFLVCRVICDDDCTQYFSDETTSNIILTFKQNQSSKLVLLTVDRVAGTRGFSTSVGRMRLFACRYSKPTVVVIGIQIVALFVSALMSRDAL